MKITEEQLAVPPTAHPSPTPVPIVPRPSIPHHLIPTLDTSPTHDITLPLPTTNPHHISTFQPYTPPPPTHHPPHRNLYNLDLSSIILLLISVLLRRCRLLFLTSFHSMRPRIVLPICGITMEALILPSMLLYQQHHHSHHILLQTMCPLVLLSNCL